MFTFLLVVHALIAALLVTVILMQKSEGGGLGMGSGPAGLMTARGAADFLSRATGVLAGLFVLMALLLATIAATRNGGTIDTSLAGQAPVGAITAPVKGGAAAGMIPMVGAPTPAAPDPLTAQALAPAAGGPPTQPAPAPATSTTPATAARAERHGHAPSVTDLKTIDTGKAVAAGGVGIQGIGGSGSAAASKPVTTAPKPATATPAPAATLSPAATPAPSSGSNTQN